MNATIDTFRAGSEANVGYPFKSRAMMQQKTSRLMWFLGSLHQTVLGGWRGGRLRMEVIVGPANVPIRSALNPILYEFKAWMPEWCTSTSRMLINTFFHPLHGLQGRHQPPNSSLPEGSRSATRGLRPRANAIVGNDKAGTWNADVTDARLPRVRETPVPIPFIHSHKLTASHADNHLFHLPIVSDRFCCALDGQPVPGCFWIPLIIHYRLCGCRSKGDRFLPIHNVREVWTCPSRRCRRSLIQVTIIDKGSSPFIWPTVVQ